MRSTRPLTLLLVLLVAAPAIADDAVEPVRTAFDPAVDGMPFLSVGPESAQDDGDSFGMSLVAIDNYLRRMKGRAEGRPEPRPSPVTRTAQEGTADAKVLGSVVQSIATAQDDGDNGPLPRSRPGDTKVMREALERMRETGEPELLGMTARDGSHSTVLFGYESGDLLVYDPSYPAETIRWPWDASRGFGAHPRLEDDSKRYGPQKKYSVGPRTALRTSRELQALRDACAQGLDVARLHDLRSRVEGTRQAPIVAGGVARPGARRADATPTRRVYVVVNGTPVASGLVGRDGGFRIPLREPLPAGRRVQLVAVTGEGVLTGANDLDTSNLLGLAGSVTR